MNINKEEKLELEENEYNNTKNSNRKKNTSSILLKTYDIIVVILFLGLITFKYPLILITPFPSGILANALYTSDLVSLSMFSIFMVFLKHKEIIYLISSSNKIFSISLLLFYIIVIIQFFIFTNYTLREFSFSLSWVVIPLSIYLYFDTFKKFIVPYFSFMWCFNFIHTFWQLYNNYQCVGIPANRNWHGCFLIITTPFIIYSIYNFLKRKYISTSVIVVLQSPIIIFTLWALYKAESRGANLSLIIAIILFISLMLFHSKNYFINKYRNKIFIAFIILTILSTVALPLFFGNKLASTITQDIRIPIWRGAINLFIDNPILGIGSPSYEASYAYYRPIEYFLRSHYFAARSTHPHNQFIYYISCYGLFGLLAVSILWFYPILYFFKNYTRFTIIEKIVFFTFLMLTLHSMLDKVMVQWPTMQLFFILQGILWGYIFTYKKGYSPPSLLSVSRRINLLTTAFCFLLSFFFFISTIYFIYSNINRSYYDRNYRMASIDKYNSVAIINKQKAINSNFNAKDIYDAGIQALLILGDYRLAYNYFSILEKHPMGIIAHLNLRKADCLMQMGRKSEALQYLKKESTVFPLSSLTLYKQILLERELGKTNDAEKTALKLIQQLKFKGLQISDMKKILSNPELDNKFHLINKKSNR